VSSTDIERLKVLVKEGDAQAAMVLRERAKRTNDMELADFLVGAREYHRTRLLHELELWEKALNGVEPYAVLLLSPGAKKIQAIKEVRAHTARGLKEAKQLVDEAQKGSPALLMRDVPYDMAHIVAGRFHVLGAVAKVVRVYELESYPLYDDAWPIAHYRYRTSFHQKDNPP